MRSAASDWQHGTLTAVNIAHHRPHQHTQRGSGQPCTGRFQRIEDSEVPVTACSCIGPSQASLHHHTPARTLMTNLDDQSEVRVSRWRMTPNYCSHRLVGARLGRWLAADFAWLGSQPASGDRGRCSYGRQDVFVVRGCCVESCMKTLAPSCTAAASSRGPRSPGPFDRLFSDPARSGANASGRASANTRYLFDRA